MIQKQNRHMSMSLYLATLAVTDTIVLASGKKACQHMQMEKNGKYTGSFTYFSTFQDLQHIWQENIMLNFHPIRNGTVQIS